MASQLSIFSNPAISPRCVVIVDKLPNIEAPVRFRRRGEDSVALALRRAGAVLLPPREVPLVPKLPPLPKFLLRVRRKTKQKIAQNL